VGLGCSISFFVMKISSKIFSLLLTWLLIQPVVAQPPSLVNFRGQLLDSSNQPVTKTVTVGLKIFSSETGGTALYTEEIGDIEVRNGQYAFQFGSAGTPDFTGVIQANAETWVEVSINNIPLSRQRFVSVPYALNAGSSYIAPGSITHASLSEEIKKDLNRSITRDMISNDLLSDIDKSNISLGSSLFLPFSSVPEVVVADKNFTIPENKVLVTANIRGHIKVGDYFVSHADSLGGNNHYINDVVILKGPKYLTIHEDVVSSTNFTQEGGFLGLLYDNDPQLPVILGWSGYNVPLGKRLVITSIRGGISIDDVLVNFKTTPVGQIPLIIGSGSSITIHTPYNFKGNSAFTGYLIDANQSLGGGLLSTGEQGSISTVIENGTITREMLDDDLQDDLNFSAFQTAHSLSSLYMPYGYDGEPVVGGNEYTVPVGKVLAIMDAGFNPNGVSGNSEILVQHENTYFWVSRPGEIVLVDQNKSLGVGRRNNGVFYPESNRGFVGLLFDSVEHITPVHATTNNFTVPTGKKLVITSNLGWIEIDSIPISSDDIVRDFPIIVSDGITLNLRSNDGRHGFSGYLIEQNRSLGGGLISSTDQTSVSGSIENGSITRDKLSEEILAELSASVSEEELNSTISEKLGSLPPKNGQLLSVPSGTEPPLGYTKVSDSRIEWKMESRNYTDGQLISAEDTLYSLLSNSLSYYDKNDSVWRSINAYPSSDHTDGAAIFFDGKIYAIGGTDTHSCSIYDIGTGNWSVGPDIPSSLPGYFIPSTHLTVAEDQLYAIFVEPNRSSSTFRNGSTAFAYKLNQSNSWVKIDIEDFAFIGGGVAAYENKIFFFGGTPWTGSSGTPASTNIFKCYDITSEEITSLSPLPQGVVDPSFFIINDHLYVLVGPVNQFFKYSFLDDEWNFAKDLPFNSNTAIDRAHSATLFKGKVWLTFEGTFSGTLVPTVYSYSGGSDQGTNLSASNSVTPSMLSDSILKYLMPEIYYQPTFTGTIRNGTKVELNPGVGGKYISYQWYKDGEPIDGATSQLFTIESFDVGYHDGNYTVVASNDFGEIESAVIELAGNSNDFRGVDISSMNFQGQDLSEALFDSTTIFSNGTSGASFSGTGVKLDNLDGPIDLRGVNLHGADLRGSDLSQALFNEQTYITAANLSGTGAVFPAGSFDLTGSNVAGVNFSESNDLTISSDTILTERDETLGRYNGANIAYNNISWGGVPNDLRGVNIAGVDLGGQDLSHVVFDSTTIFSSDSLGFSSGASLSSVGNNGPNLTNLSGIIDLRGVNLFGSNLSDSDLSRVKLNDFTRIEDTNLTNVNLCGLDLSGAFGGTETPSWASSNSYFNTYYDAETVFPDDFDPAQEPGLVFVSDSFTVGGGQLSAPYFTIDNDQGIVDFTSYKLRPGNTYSFRSWEITDEHSFMIGESYGDMNSSMVYRGPLTRGNEGSFMFLTIPEGFAGSLFYFCPDHSSMVQEFTLSPANHVADLNSTVSLEMIWVEPGTFMMGSPETEEGRMDRETQHQVTLTSGFYLGKYEVTQAQYQAVMKGVSGDLNATPSISHGFPNRPVENVSLNDIEIFLERLNSQESGNIPAGWAYVLPTEAQWEYACRADTNTSYYWGDSINSNDANYGNNIGHTSEVGLYDANPWGFFDMHGNVSEWTPDWFEDFSSFARTDPVGPSLGPGRVVKGGSFNDPRGFYSRSAHRSVLNHRFRYGNNGFRLALRQVQ